MIDGNRAFVLRDGEVPSPENGAGAVRVPWRLAGVIAGARAGRHRQTV